MEETPKLHGWITPEYAAQIWYEMTDFIVDNTEFGYDILKAYLMKKGLMEDFKTECPRLR